MLGFFAATIAWSWLFLVPVTLWLREHSLDGAPWWIYLGFLLGAYGPSIMGLAFAARTGGRLEFRRLLGSLVSWRVGVRWYLVGLLVPAAITLIAVLLFIASGGAFGTPSYGRLALAPIALLFAIPFGPLGEELGWRGFALPRLVERHGAIAASIILGLVWTLWHTPLFWAPAGSSISGMPVTVLTIGAYAGVLIGISFLYTWVLARTGGSVLMAVVIHPSFNTDVALLPFSPLPDAAKLGTLYFSLVPLAALVVWSGLRLRGLKSLRS